MSEWEERGAEVVLHTSSSVKRQVRRGGIAKGRRPFGWSLAVIGLLGLTIIFVGWAVVGWPVLVAAAVAALVVRFF